jgi:hypothetical protein
VNEATTPRDGTSSAGCPGAAEVDARFEEPALRAHVAACDSCLEQFGPLFELELFAPALPREVTAAPRLPIWRRVERVAVAAALLVAALLASRVHLVAPAAAPPHEVAARVLALSLSESTCDRTGCFEIRRTFDAQRPALCRLEEIRTNADGTSAVRERLLPLAAAKME